MSTLVGTLLDARYRLDAQIGVGGMSTVYRAFDQVLEREVAIKLLNREIARDSDQLERFRREARAVAQLSDPHIVGVIDAGEDEGHPYIVFEFVEGETLKQRIRRAGRLPIPEAVAYAIEIARALGVAHARGIVHRDVKPQNVLIDAEGGARVTDFGIARSLEEDGLTADGRVLGTTDYVSPEQALGNPVTPQSDLYSLGVVLFEMLTGEVPFRGETQVAVAMKHVRDELPDVLIRRPECSAALAAIVDRATAKDLAVRYLDDADLIADLEEALAVEAARAGSTAGEASAVLRTLPPRTRRRVPRQPRTATVAAVAIVVLLAAAGITGIVIENTHRGTGTSGPKAPSGTKPVSVGLPSANAFDPIRGDGEHDADASSAVDKNENTYWSTETYTDGLGSKPGVGIYVDAKPSLNAKVMKLQTTTPGFEAQVYGAPASAPAPLAAPTTPGSGWVALTGPPAVVNSNADIALDATQRYRYYLLWITKLSPGTAVKIQEIRLYKP